MRKLLLLLLVIPLLLAAAPEPTGTAVVASKDPVTIVVTLDQKPKGGWTTVPTVSLQCSNGYSAFDLEPFIFDGTAWREYTPDLRPGGNCVAYVAAQTYNRSDTQRIYTDITHVYFYVHV